MLNHPDRNYNYPPPRQGELHVQAFLRFHAPTHIGNALDLLEARYGIKAKRHGEFPNLVLFKYNQVESPFVEPIVQECRGIILDSRDDWRVVAMPYRRFFNLGEPHAAAIDWETADVYEKLDGSLITLYRYAGEWQVATSGTPDANCEVQGYGLTFAELFWRTAREQGLRTEHLQPYYTYMLELCAPENRVVVRHERARIYLHGVRYLPTLEERDPSYHADVLGVPAPRRFDLSSAADCVAAARELAPLECEGYVVCDAGFNRVKIKSPAYVALHHCKDGLMSRRKIAEVIRAGEAAEFEKALDAFPELRQTFEELKTRYESLCIQAIRAYSELRGIADQKAFALEAKQYGDLQNILFAMRKRGCTPAAYLQGLTPPAYERIMGV